MAMIQCPHCGKPVSDKAVFCPHCKERLIEEETIICPECGSSVPKTSTTCPVCGAPLAKQEDPQKVELTKITTPSINKDTTKKILVGVLGLVLIVATVFGYKLYSKKQQAVKWQETYNNAVSTMLTGGILAEDEASLIHDVWYNTIYKEADPRTNRYTFTSRYRNDTKYTSKDYASKEYFNSDFNDSLAVLLNSSEHATVAAKIQSNKKTVEEYMAELSKSIPEGKENAYNAINDLYDQYLGLTNCAVNPTGNLNSYTSSINQYDSDFVKAYNKAKTFIEQ